METRINHNPRNPISAKVHEKVGSFLTLDFEQPNGNTISLFLPPHMGVVTHLIADLFNSHIGKSVSGVTSPVRGLADQLGGNIAFSFTLPHPADPIAPLPTGSGISTEGVIAIAAVMASEQPIAWSYQIGDVNDYGHILVRVSDETVSWLERGKAWVTAEQAGKAGRYGWETELVMRDGTYCISKR